MSDSSRSYELLVLPESFGVCRFPPTALLPSWVDHGKFWTVSRTPDELSIVCEEEGIPSSVHSETGFACLKVISPLDFSAVGVIADLSGALAASGISILTISTFDTDYVLVRQTDLPDAIDSLREAGHVVQF